ncbi:battenin-like [Babylonia areolata]|uniref:battenin-like n=1 Tax=Babylonia areolata TaxID=304850 RepID=UPI003FD3E66D
MGDIRSWIGLFLMGSINNLPYVIVNSASNTIAASFDEKNLVGLVFGANVALSVFVKGLNTFALLSVPFSVRYVVNGFLMLLGLFGVAYAFSFGFALACIVVVGSTAAFGENVSLGMMSRYPSHLINAWSSGTGMAGLLGSSIYIVFGCTVGTGGDQTEKLRHLTKYAFLLTTPVVLVYWLAYFVVLRSPSVGGQIRRRSEGDEEEEGRGEEGGPYISSSSSSSPGQSSPPPPPQTTESIWRRIRRCFGLVWYLALNLCAVYVFEYVARGCAAKVRPDKEYHVGCPELYAALQLCYQMGVFVSRSSVQMFKIRSVGVMSVLQFFNMVLWIVDAKFKVVPVYLLPALMIVVGLLGGASYVNIFYMLLHDPVYPDRDREFCINVTAMFITLGIVLGTGLETALFTTLLKDD